MATTTANKLQISAGNFFRRVKSFYAHWKDSHKEFSTIDAICILNGKNEEESIKIKTSAIYVWLFGYELLDSVLFFTKKSIVFLASPKHLALLEHFHAEKGTLDLELQFIPKEDQDNSRNFDKIKATLESDTGLESFKFGRLVKEKQASPFSSEFETFFAKLPQELVEIGPLIQDTLCVKESEELDLVRKAGRVCVWFEDKVIVEVENIIDSEVKTRHSDISKKIEALLENPNEVKHLETQTKVDKQLADLVYTPIIQSGGDYDLRPQAESTDAYLSYDTIICSVGAKYSEYNCNVVRTLFIDPNTEQRQNYNIAHELQKLVLSKLKPGSVLKSVYDSSIEYVKSKKREDLISKLPANLGYGIGLEFREQNLAINNKNEKIIEAGMVFNVTISLSGLKTKNDKEYAIMIADTAIVKPQGPEVLTARIAREYKEISYSLQGEEVVEEKKTNQTQNNKQLTTSKRTRANGQKVEFNEIKRREHQKELRAKKLSELEDRFSSGNFYGDKAKSKIETEKLVSYRNANDLPKDMKKNQIYVDMKNDCVLVPIFGKMVPFHINVIKNVSKQEEDKRVNALRLNFHVPLATASTITFPEASEQNMMYIRELIFKSRNIKNIGDTIKKLKDLQKKAKEKATEEREKKASFNPEDEPLQLVTKGRRPILKDLKVRPNITGKRTSGNLEAHLNGFRFIPQKGEKIDVTFKNIKHAFFQPCDSEMIILVHFHLIKPIIIGKKRSYDVQFYTEAGLQAEDLDVRRRGNDDDEIEQEEREKAQRKKLNNEFESFTKAVEAASPNEIEFEVPWRELSFQGAPFKSSVSLYPTVHCLVSLTETPFFIMNLDEVEVAHFERVQYGLRNFDLNFIYKDYSRPVTRICAIPANYLDITKDWLDKMDIIFSESTVNFDWNKILNEVRTQVRDDPKHFLDDGGWDFLQPSGSEDGEGGMHPEDGDDSAFEVSESEDDEESESGGYSEDDDDDDEEEGSSSFDGEDDLEEEGLSWDEMEQLAEKEDKQKLADKKLPFKKPPMKDSRQQVKKVKK